MDVPVRARLEARTREWCLDVERVEETRGSLVAFARRAGERVVLKIFSDLGEAQRCGDVLESFDGSPVVRLRDRAPGALLLERLAPGTPLSVVSREDDDRATVVLAEVIGGMWGRIPQGIPSVARWGASFDCWTPTGASVLSGELVQQARALNARLSASQREVRLLHGDLHHDNVLLDDRRGWVVIDPKGVAGEVEFELGAALRNPLSLPHLVTSPAIIDARLRCFAHKLNVDAGRVGAWAFAQAVLAVVWLEEDGEGVASNHPWLTFARTLKQRIRVFR